MPDSPPPPPGDSPSIQTTPNSPIPIEIVTEEEMALLESALLAASKSSFRISKSPCFTSNVRSIESITVRSKRRLLFGETSQSESVVKDIEDLGGNKQKRVRKLDSLLHRFRRNRALSVTDIVASEWCQKKKEFDLVLGKPKATEAMKAGTKRHAKLEQEVIQKVEVHYKEIEDSWALQLINFIIRATQLLFEGLTRELPLVGFVQGVWMVGVIDELRLSAIESVQSPYLVEYKTRFHPTLPSEAQKRNGKLQLMCYKYMWDNIVTTSFPASRFYTFFGLNAHYILSEEVQALAATSGLPAKSLDDVVMYYRNTCASLSPAHDELLLRYEHEGDHLKCSLEEKFTYDSEWHMSQLKCSLEFWLGEHEASYVSEEERWKCGYCQFAPVCPNTSTEDNTVQYRQLQ